MRKYIGMIVFFLLAACANSQRPVKNMPHYDLSKPEIYSMQRELREISGIAMIPGGVDSILAEQDEEGKVYYFKLGDHGKGYKFGVKGDYEDITIYRNTVYMLRSDGSLFAFPLSQVKAGKVTDVRSWGQLLPAGEYEGMFADQKNKKLYVLCKHCAGEKTNKTGGGSVFTIQNDGTIIAAGNFQIDIGEIEKLSAVKKIEFHPSALAMNPSTGDWFILSSVNGMLVVADANWKVKEVYPLDKTIFNQPEGISFDSLNNLYISNEGGAGAGNILKFAYRK